VQIFMPRRRRGTHGSAKTKGVEPIQTLVSYRRVDGTCAAMGGKSTMPNTTAKFFYEMGDNMTTHFSSHRARGENPSLLDLPVQIHTFRCGLWYVFKYKIESSLNGKTNPSVVDSCTSSSLPRWTDGLLACQSA